MIGRRTAIYGMPSIMPVPSGPFYRGGQNGPDSQFVNATTAFSGGGQTPPDPHGSDASPIFYRRSGQLWPATQKGNARPPRFGGATRTLIPTVAMRRPGRPHHQYAPLQGFGPAPFSSRRAIGRLAPNTGCPAALFSLGAGGESGLSCKRDGQ